MTSHAQKWIHQYILAYRSVCKSEKLARLKRNTKVLKRDLKTFKVGIILRDQIAIDTGKYSKPTSFPGMTYVKCDNAIT